MGGSMAGVCPRRQLSETTALGRSLGGADTASDAGACAEAGSACRKAEGCCGDDGAEGAEGADDSCVRDTSSDLEDNSGTSGKVSNRLADKNGWSSEKPERRLRARDAQGGCHRAQEWRGATGYFGEGSPIDVVRVAQRAWLEENPSQLLKWAFPTRQRDCLRISFRAASKTESLCTDEFRVAFGELVTGYPRTVVRTISYLYLNYLHPYHKRIQAQGRHLMMLKVYEGKNEAHCWHIPLKEVVELHKKSAGSTTAGVSLNDVQLVQTYVLESTFVLHIETFERDRNQHGNMYGRCTWVGGMALHLITEEQDGPRHERSQEFALMPDEHMAELTEKRGKLRERRARKKAELKSRKEEEAAAQAAKEQIDREREDAAAAARSKEGLVQPHESLTKLLKTGVADPDWEQEALGGDFSLTDEELAAFSMPRRKEGLIQPHASLSKLLADTARARS
mmetsp:Transcript_113100/g.320066  ORF Transcript_113100/g.320066 Transcript_113100/m.320066 type:complete len:452 (-) Transcript_113100:95-1450(-)